MNAVFGSLKEFIQRNPIQIDNPIFRLHYRATAIILFAFSLLVTARQYIGEPIQCQHIDKLPTEFIDTFCWIHSTFSIQDAWYGKVGIEIPYPGISKTNHDTLQYHGYYQWVCFVLFLQAIAFYTPHYIWKTIEGGLVKRLVDGLETPILDPDTRQKKYELVVEYLQVHLNHHQRFGIGYVCSEFLNFIHVVFQLCLLDRFLNGQFASYGYRVMTFTHWNWALQYDPMMQVFPRMAKCTFYNYGSSSEINRYDVLCLLPNNIVNEKIFLFLWFWLISLAIVSALVVVYRIISITMPRLWKWMILSKSKFIQRSDLHLILQSCTWSDSIVFMFLAKNMDCMHFKRILHDFASRLRICSQEEEKDQITFV